MKPVAPVKGHNRAARKKAARTFADLRKEEWGPWEEIDFRLDAAVRGVTAAIPTGLRRVVKNNRYIVQFFVQQTEWGTVDQLLVRRNDGKPNVSWADMQRIKDELMGSDRTAVEVYPSAANLVDEADCYHLWVLPVGFDLPFGLHQEGWSK